MRSADPDEQARIDATLGHLAGQLHHACIPTTTAKVILTEAERILLLRPHHAALGWLITWSDHDTRHVGIPDLALAITQSAGRLGIVIDLEHSWAQAVGWQHTLVEAAQRHHDQAARTPHTNPPKDHR